MMTYNPITALILFFAFLVLLYVVFRPVKGWFWIVKKNFNSNEKVIIEDILKQLYHFLLDKKILKFDVFQKLILYFLLKNQY